MAGNIKGITIEIGGNTTKLDKALREVNKTSKDLNNQLKDVEKSLKFNPGNFELITQKQRMLAESVENTREKLKLLKDAQEQAKQSLQNGDLGQDEYDALRREIIKTENQLKTFEGQQKKVNSALNNMGESLERFGKKSEQLGKKLAPVSAVAAGIGGLAIKTAADFEAGMSEVGAISGATGENLKKLEEKAKEMGATTKFSASQSAEALKYMAMAGWDTQKMLDGLPGVMNLAAASGEELGTVSDIVTDAMTAFGLEASEAGRFADILANASSRSNTNVGLLGESFKYVAPLAGAMGYSAEDVATALGLMANAGIKGSQSGTALRTSLARLAKPTKDVDDGLRLIGLSAENLQGISLDETLKRLRVAFRDLDQTQKAAAASTIFGKEAMSGMLAILNASDEEYNSLRESMYNADGVAKQMADTMNDNLNGQITLLKSALEGLAITTGNIFMPHIKGAVGVVQGFTDALNNAHPVVQQIIAGVIAFVAVLAPILIVGGKVVTLIGIMASAIGGLIAFFSAGGAGAVALGTAFTILTGPIGVVVVAIAGIIAIGVLLIKHWDDLKKWSSDLWNAFSSYIKKIWNDIGAFLHQKWTDISNWATNSFNGIRDFIFGSFDNIYRYASQVWDNIYRAITKPIDDAKEHIRNALDAIGGFFSNLKFELPKIKLPHFSMKGDFSLVPPSVPTVGVDWYDKGGIFTKPSIIGVGEKRPEFVGALEDLSTIVGKEIEKRGSDININVEKMEIRKESDLQKMAQLLYEMIKRDRRIQGMGG